MTDSPKQELCPSSQKHITVSKARKSPKSSFSSSIHDEISNQAIRQTSPAEMKTPLKSMHQNDKYTFAKESLRKTEPITSTLLLDSEHTEVKSKPDFRTIQADQNETETRKYYRLIGSAEAETSDTRKSIKVQHSSQSSENSDPTVVRSLILSQETSKRNSQKAPTHIMISKRRRSRVIFDKSPLYFPSKKVKNDSEFYNDTLEVFDKLKKQHVKFRLFKDKDLGYSRAVQNTVRASKVDDDCPTDSEQMELAKKHVQKQLRQAIEMQEFWSSKSSSFSSTSRFSSYGPTSRGISSYVPNSSFSTDTFSESGASDDTTTQSQEFDNVVKKLSYSKAKDSVNQEKKDLMSPEAK